MTEKVNTNIAEGEQTKEWSPGLLRKLGDKAITMNAEGGGEPKLEKVSEQLGSNEGGWYKDSETGVRSYVKFYENPDQGRVEYVANAIYKKLGIKAAQTELIELDGRQAVASKEVIGAEPASVDEQRSSEDVHSGFVADAYLANWDVVGLVYDNIVRGEDGLYRIDNGGSMTFRAMGGDKEFVADSIPELESMLEPSRPAGEVFKGITQEDIEKEARALVEKLQPEFIEATVAESGLKGEARDRVLSGLLGRREYLAERFPALETKPRVARRLRDVLRTMRNAKAESLKEMEVRPRQEVVCDHDHIEGQRIDVIDREDKDMTEVIFKLREEAFERATEAINAGREIGDSVLEWGSITYTSASTEGSFKLANAYEFTKSGMKIALAKPNVESRTALGMVKVEIPKEKGLEEIEGQLDEILRNNLMVSGGLGEVPEEAERQYKRARYSWHHKIDGEMTAEQLEVAEKLKRKEVYSGYSTMVEEGRHKKYIEDYGEMRAVHSMHMGDTESIYGVLTNGLMASSERYMRGFLRNGMSTHHDFLTGGGDSVFVRTCKLEEVPTNAIEAIVVMKPELYDRTDWYAYGSDHYGRTDESTFSGRVSPESLFDAMQNGALLDGNEQMFRMGIGVDYIEKIIVSYGRNTIVSQLKEMGLTEVNGKSIDDIIVTTNKESEIDTFLTTGDMDPEELKQEILSGNFENLTIDALIDITGGEDAEGLISLMNTIIERGGQKKLADEAHSWLLEVMNLEDMQAMENGEVIADFGEDDMKVVIYMRDVVGVDFSEIAEELEEKAESEDKDKDNDKEKVLYDDEPFF